MRDGEPHSEMSDTGHSPSEYRPPQTSRSSLESAQESSNTRRDPEKGERGQHKDRYNDADVERADNRVPCDDAKEPAEHGDKKGSGASQHGRDDQAPETGLILVVLAGPSRRRIIDGAPESG